MFDAPVLLDYAITLFLMSFRYRLIATFANYVGRKHSLLSGSAVVCYCLRVCFSVCFLILSVCLLVWVFSVIKWNWFSICQSVSFLFVNECIFLSASQFFCLSVCQSVYLFTDFSVKQLLHLFICRFVCLYICHYISHGYLSLFNKHSNSTMVTSCCRESNIP